MQTNANSMQFAPVYVAIGKGVQNTPKQPANSNQPMSGKGFRQAVANFAMQNHLGIRKHDDGYLLIPSKASGGQQDSSAAGRTIVRQQVSEPVVERFINDKGKAVKRTTTKRTTTILTTKAPSKPPSRASSVRSPSPAPSNRV